MYTQKYYSQTHFQLCVETHGSVMNRSSFQLKRFGSAGSPDTTSSSCHGICGNCTSCLSRFHVNNKILLNYFKAHFHSYQSGLHKLKKMATNNELYTCPIEKQTLLGTVVVCPIRVNRGYCGSSTTRCSVHRFTVLPI